MNIPRTTCGCSEYLRSKSSHKQYLLYPLPASTSPHSSCLFISTNIMQRCAEARAALPSGYSSFSSLPLADDISLRPLLPAAPLLSHPFPSFSFVLIISIQHSWRSFASTLHWWAACFVHNVSPHQSALVNVSTNYSHPAASSLLYQSLVLLRPLFLPPLLLRNFSHKITSDPAGLHYWAVTTGSHEAHVHWTWWYQASALFFPSFAFLASFFRNFCLFLLFLLFLCVLPFHFLTWGIHIYLPTNNPEHEGRRYRK